MKKVKINNKISFLIYGIILTIIIAALIIVGILIYLSKSDLKSPTYEQPDIHLTEGGKDSLCYGFIFGASLSEINMIILEWAC